MFKKIIFIFIAPLLVLLTTSSFAIAPGAGQAQTRNNMQQMQQNKAQIEQRQRQMQQEHKKMMQKKKKASTEMMNQ